MYGSLEHCVHEAHHMKFRALASLSFVALVTTACGTATEPATSPSADGDDDRGPLGKADQIGSCEAPEGEPSFCGGKSDGNCWCDELCEGFGDCCDDHASVCEDDGGCEPVLCELFCENGFATDEDGCEVCSCEPDPMIPCGGFAGFVCPEGLECVDIPDDGCHPDMGGADCLGMCVEPTGCTAADCGPAPGAPNFECSDGETIGGPACTEGDDGECGWVFVECPDEGPTCEGACGGPADGGACWCDDLCEQFGDCCDDFTDACAPEPNCGEDTCSDSEVCITHVTQLGPQRACAAIGEDCDGEATCGCMGAEVCTGVFDLCNDDADGGLSCGCPVC